MQPNPNKIKFAFCVLGVAILHFFGTFMLAFISGTTGGAASKLATNVLTFPISMLSGGPDNPLVGWGAWILLSLLWGFAFCTIVRVFLAAIQRN